MSKYKVNAVKYEEVYVDNESIVKILKNEIDVLLGREDRYIYKGIIYEREYRYDNDIIIGETSNEIIDKYNALNTIIKHFENK